MRKPFHPVLFAAFPVLFLFRENRWGIRTEEILLPLGATIVGAVALFVVLRLLMRSPRKAAIVTSVLAVVFLVYGHVWRLLVDERGRTFGVDGDLLLGPLLVLIIVAVAIAVGRSRRTLLDATRVLNLFAIAMVATIAVPLTIGLIAGTAQSVAIAPPRLPDGEDPQVKRDIYYLVFDRYAGGRALKELFGFENREFLGHLEDNGFDVADRSRANYQSTVPSLVASLNMNYLDWIGEQIQGEARESSVPFYDAIKDPEVVRFLKRHGYRYVHVGSRWDMTRDSPSADVNVRLDEVSEFTRVFLGSTALLPAMRHGFLVPEWTDSPELARELNLRQITEVMAAKRFDGPKFVFSHFSLPHPPYVFDRYGNPEQATEATVAEKARAYLEQLLYTNRRITEIVHTLLDARPGREPIIILQADEGTYPSFGWRTPFRWWTTTDRNLRTKFDILMATHMPGVADTATYEELSPVNVFRIVLNAYFATDLPLLPDHSYVPRERGVHYDWVDITDRLDDPVHFGDGPLYPPRVSALPPPSRSS